MMKKGPDQVYPFCLAPAINRFKSRLSGIRMSRLKDFSECQAPWPDAGHERTSSDEIFY